MHFTSNFQFSVVCDLVCIYLVTIPGHAYRDRLCTPSNSPLMPDRLHEPALVRAAFKKFVHAVQGVNVRRFNYAQTRNKSGASIFKVLVGIQVDSLGPYSLGGVLPAIDIALESVQNHSAFKGVTFAVEPILSMDSLPCDTLAALDKLQNESIHVLFGPLNDFTIASNARYSTSMFNVPIITPGGYANQLADKVEFAMLTRVFFSYADLYWIFGATLKAFGWVPEQKPPLAVFSYRDPKHQSRAGGPTSLVSVFQQQSIQNLFTNSTYVLVSPAYEDDYISAANRFLRDLRSSARIAILCADPDVVRYIMLRAHELGYTNGKYVFFNVDIFSNREVIRQAWYRNTSDAEENDKARQAYRTLMTVVAKVPDISELHAFSNNLRDRAERDYNHVLNEADISMFITLFHDAVKLYLLALDSAMQKNISIIDGKAISQLMRNRTFQGMTGTVRIDNNGDRYADYSLLDMDPQTGIFRIVADYYGNERLLRFIRNASIDWHNAENQPPLHTPKCGFDDSLCHDNYYVSIAVTISAVAAILIGFAVSSTYMYRRMKSQAELRALNWIIDWSELKLSNGPNDKLFDCHKGQTTDHDTSYCAMGDSDHRFNRRALSPISSNTCIDCKTGDNAGPSPVERGEVLLQKPSRRKISLKPSLTSFNNTEAGGNRKRPTLLPVTFAEEHVIVPGVGEKFEQQQKVPLLQPGGDYVVKSPTRDDSVVLPQTTTPNAVQRIQQRFARISRSAATNTNEHNQQTTPSSAGCNNTGGASSIMSPWSGAVVQRISPRTSSGNNPMYIKSPSFDYSTLTGSRNKAYGRKRFDLQELEQNHLTESGAVHRKKKESQTSTLSHELHFEEMFRDDIVVTYKGSRVYLKPLRKQNRIDANKDSTIEVKKVKDLNHDNICRFVGACLEYPHLCLIYEHCPRGSILDLLHRGQLTLDWEFKVSLIQDIWRGLNYLHQMFGPHGNMKSSNCLLDSRFAVKLTDFGIPRLRGTRLSKHEFGSADYYKSLLWTAPELLPREDEKTDGVIVGTLKGDVYSFAIICQELIYCKGTFYVDDQDQPEPKVIIDSLRQHKRPFLRPKLEVHDECNEEFVNMVRGAWDDDQASRLTFRVIGKVIRADAPTNIFDNLMERMKHYAENLELIVKERTKQCQEEKKRAEDLLYSMLPQTVASQLIQHKVVQAESFDMVTIYFSDIVGFTELSAASLPMEIVEMLNQLYTLFDEIIEKFDAYKVETIGDAYMVASGLPTRNGNRHAREVARMSIAFLKAIFEFQIPHRRNERLELRIGVHSGPVCAGVIGQKMPRYCLFGDTVNTSSRMESNGQPMKIHISQQTFDVLKTFNSFIMTERGVIRVKGKGNMKTYWLHGECNWIVTPVPPGAILLGGPLDGAVGPIPAGAIQNSRSSPEYPVITRPQLPNANTTTSLSTQVELYTPNYDMTQRQVSTTSELCSTQVSDGLEERHTGVDTHPGVPEAYPANSHGHSDRGKRRTAVCYFNGSSVQRSSINTDADIEVDNVIAPGVNDQSENSTSPRQQQNPTNPPSC